MPAPLNVDKEQVRMLVLSVGVREAARQCQINENTVLDWSRQGKWLEPTRAKPAELPPPASMQSPIVPIKPADALANTLADDSKTTRFKLGRAVRAGAEHAAGLAGADVLKEARKLKDLAGTAAQVFEWQGGSQAVKIDIFAHQVDTRPVIDI